MINRKLQPELKKIKTLYIPEPQEARLDNQIPVFMFNAGNIGITRLDFIFDAGSCYQDKPLIASYTNKMLTEGTLSYSAYEIARKLDFYGAWISKSVTKDSAALSLSVLNKHLKYVLPVLNEIINHPEFPENELHINTQKDKQGFIDDCRKVNEVASMNFNHQLFGKRHPYGTLVKAEDFDKLEHKQLSVFHNQRYTAANCKIIVSGKLSRDILSQLNYCFGYVQKSRTVQKTKKSPQIISGTQKQFIEMPSAVQSAIRIGKIAVNKTHEDYLKLFILNTLLGGYFGSRLMKNIREDKGYTYGIYSMVRSYRQSAAFVIASEVGAGVCRDALREIYKELKILNSEPVDPQELDLVRKYLAGTLIRNFDGPFQVADRFISLLEYGIDYKKYYTDFLNTINTVTAEDLFQISGKYFDPDSMFELVAGKQ
ncbi:MAG TPA: pitrilysin family protein [Bacteroidales bacterium]|nr:pitrilysin family protein [Bacteroidales bacterium]